MPRTTRAALRSKELAEEEAVAASVPLPLTPLKERVPLSEVANNKVAGSMVADSAENEPIMQGAKNGRKARGARKGKNKQVKNKLEKTNVEILEDGNLSSASSAAEEAREELMNGQSDQILSVTGDDSTAPSSAAKMASQQLASAETSQQAVDSSWPQQEGTITTHAPDQPTGRADRADEEAKEDSSVEQIKSRSPVKRISRIEDSVEALDKLEEEIEKAGQDITPPPTTSGLPPVVKTENSTKKDESLPKVSNSNGKSEDNQSKSQEAPSSKVANGASKPVKRAVQSTAGKAIKPKENRASLLRQGIKPTSPARAERIVPKPKGTAVTVTTKAPVPAPSTRRISSATKAPFQPVKSTKPPTQPTFELPGEAISRKKKEQREERLKREEEEKAKKRSFKARPMSLGHAPEVKMTAATRARLSVTKQDSNDGPQKLIKRPSPLASSVSSLNSTRRSSSLTVSKRSNPLSNSPGRRAPSRLSVSGEPRSAPTTEDVAHQKLKGKEAFSRPQNELAAREKARREKEEAARKARIEAAERGRAASREWAEKQKAKKAAAAVAKGNIVA